MLAGEYAAAERFSRITAMLREETLGQEHPDTLTSVNQFGSVLEKQRKYKEPQSMHRRAMEGRENVLGVKHPDTLASVNNLWVSAVEQREIRRGRSGASTSAGSKGEGAWTRAHLHAYECKQPWKRGG